MSSEDTENLFGEERYLGKNVRVFIAKNSRLGARPVGITFVLTAANIPLSKYISIRDALLSINHVVVGYMINALNPPLRNHRTKAQNVRDVFDELATEMRGVDRFDIVGHSVGGKIALLVAALHNVDGALRNVLALDPVDQSPVEFTNQNKAKNLSLVPDADFTHNVLKRTNITMTYTDTGFFVKADHNGRAIHRNNSQNTKLVNHRNAGHMCYCDAGGKISWGSVMKMADNGSEERNKKCKEEVICILKEKEKSKIGKGLKSAGKGMKGGLDDLKKDVDKVAKGGMVSMMAKSLMKF